MVRNITALLLAVKLTSAALAFQGHTAADAEELYLRELEAIDRRFPKDAQLQEASGHVRDAAATTLPSLPDGYGDEVAEAIADQLRRHVSGLEQYATRQYKTTFLAVRFVELAENIRLLEFRPVADSSEKREEARQQYDRLIDFASSQLNESSTEIEGKISELIGQTITNALAGPRDDVFAIGYGNPLSRDSFEEVRTIISKAITEGIELSKTVRPSDPASNYMDAASRIAMGSREKLETAISSQNDISPQDSTDEMIAALGRTKKLKDSLLKRLRQAEELELAAIVDRSNETPQPAPAVVGSSSNYGGPPVNDVAEDQSIISRRSLVISANVLLICVIIVIMLVRSARTT